MGRNPSRAEGAAQLMGCLPITQGTLGLLLKLGVVGTAATILTLERQTQEHPRLKIIPDYIASVSLSIQSERERERC